MQQADGAFRHDLASSYRESALIHVKRLFLGIVVGAVVFVAVMFLMLLAVRQASSAAVTNSIPRYEGPSADSSSYLAIEDLVADFRVDPAGTREVQVTGNVQNTGKTTVLSADLKCYFRTRDGGESPLELVLIVDTMSDEIGAGPLKPMTTRKFGARVGNFPDDFEPELVRYEIVNVRTEKDFLLNS